MIDANGQQQTIVSPNNQQIKDLSLDQNEMIN